MKLRWSNAKDYAEVFEANDIGTFRENGLATLRVFRAATYRKVHRGDIHRDELWFDNPELHVEVADAWLTPGLIKATDTGTKFFEPFQTRFAISAGSLDDIHDSDSEILSRSGELFWQGVHDVYRWNGALEAMVMSVGDEINRAEQRSKAAAILGSEGGKSTSKAKAAAARRNGRKGGRPKGS